MVEAGKEGEKKRKRNPPRSKYGGPKSVYKSPPQLFFKIPGTRSLWTVEYQTSNRRNGDARVRLLDKHFVANRWWAAEIEVQFQEHQQLSHLAARIAYTRPYIEASWHREAAGLGLTWCCHHPEHQAAAKGPGQIPTGSSRMIIWPCNLLSPSFPPRAANY